MTKKFAIGQTVKTNSNAVCASDRGRTGTIIRNLNDSNYEVGFTDGKAPSSAYYSGDKLDAYASRLAIGTRFETTIREYAFDPGRVGTIVSDNGFTYQVRFDDKPDKDYTWYGGFLKVIHGTVKPRRKKGDVVRPTKYQREGGRKGVIDLVLEDGTCTVEFQYSPCCPDAPKRGIYKDNQLQPADLKEGSRVIVNFDSKNMGRKAIVTKVRESGENYDIKFDDGTTKPSLHGSWLWMDDTTIQVGDTVTITHTFTVDSISGSQVRTPFGAFSQDYLRNHGAVITERAPPPPPPPYVPRPQEDFIVLGKLRTYKCLYADLLVVVAHPLGDNQARITFKISEEKFEEDC